MLWHTNLQGILMKSVESNGGARQLVQVTQTTKINW